MRSSLCSLVPMRELWERELLCDRCFVVTFTQHRWFLVFYKKIRLKEDKVWWKALAKISSRLSHRVCRRLSSPVLLRKFTYWLSESDRFQTAGKEQRRRFVRDYEGEHDSTELTRDIFERPSRVGKGIPLSSCKAPVFHRFSGMLTLVKTL